MNVNKPVDDIAERMHLLFKDVGLGKEVIRMKSWPSELRKSEYLGAEKDAKEPVRIPDFTRSFLNLAISSQRDPDRAPTLDQAAWTHFKHGMTKYHSLALPAERIPDAGL
jgi:hypothetical protein